MKFSRINAKNLTQAIKYIGTDKMGENIMSKKAEILGFMIEDLSFEAMGILKQEALSVGAECATPRGAIAHKGQKMALLFGSKAQIESIAKKLSCQPFKLKELKNYLLSHTHAQDSKQSPRIMAIINITPDSFYDKSRQNDKSAIERLENLLEKGIKLIDIGAASSRPGSELIKPSVEIARLKAICAYIKSHKLYEKATFSIDTYNPKTANYALESGFSMINDVSGLDNPKMIEIAKAYHAQVVLMHTKGTPKVMQNLVNSYEDFFGEMDKFFAQKIALLRENDIQHIVLDIGFGFAKNMTQNLALIQHLEHFKRFNLPLLVGASRKNTIGIITGRDTHSRLSGTLALHLIALQNGADIVRVHDEDEHIDILKIFQAMQDFHSPSKEIEQ